jgi:RNase adaptor protein for sRNA GlmZ degradation
MSASQAGRRGFDPRLPLIKHMLNIKIYSFSYKKSGIPADDTINGGGFVFDCRYIYNPGREERFKSITGKDKDVIQFLESTSDMKAFLESVYIIIDGAAENYIMRNFTDLMVSFGCTGGQHRSIYASEKLKQHLLDKYGDKIKVTLNHREFPELSN